MNHVDPSVVVNRLSAIPILGTVIGAVTFVINLVCIVRDVCCLRFYEMRQQKNTGSLDALRGRASKIDPKKFQACREKIQTKHKEELEWHASRIKYAESNIQYAKDFEERMSLELKAGNVFTIFQEEGLASKDLDMAKHLLNKVDQEIAELQKQKREERYQPLDAPPGSRIDRPEDGQKFLDKTLADLDLFRAKLSHDFQAALQPELKSRENRLHEMKMALAQHLKEFGDEPRETGDREERNRLQEAVSSAQVSFHAAKELNDRCQKNCQGVNVENIDLHHTPAGEGMAIGLQKEVASMLKDCSAELKNLEDERGKIESRHMAELRKLEEQETEGSTKERSLESRIESDDREIDSWKANLDKNRHFLGTSIVRAIPILSLTLWDATYEEPHRYTHVKPPDTKK